MQTIKNLDSEKLLALSFADLWAIRQFLKGRADLLVYLTNEDVSAERIELISRIGQISHVLKLKIEELESET